MVQLREGLLESLKRSTQRNTYMVELMNVQSGLSKDVQLTKRQDSISQEDGGGGVRCHLAIWRGFFAIFLVAKYFLTHSAPQPEHVCAVQHVGRRRVSP